MSESPAEAVTEHRPAAPAPVSRAPVVPSAVGSTRVKRRSSGPSRTIINFWLDVFLLCNFVLLCWIAAVLQFVFPAGVNSAGWTLWGWGFQNWQNLQFSTLCLMAGAVTLHVMLHWSWVCGVINKWILRRLAIKTDGTDTLIGVGLIALLLHLIGLGVLLAKWSIQH